MKHPRRTRTVAPEHLIPRRNRRGLIEAPRGPGPRGGRGRSIPRRNRRGLIEAAPCRSTRPRPPWPIPRRNRRGLIEACQLWQWNRLQVVGFPGEIAGASLKLRSPGRRPRPPVRFPGEIAGASLKHRGGPGPDPPLRSIPRRNRRGLIEAGRRRRTTSGSGWRIPRRNRRGLIEARTSTSTSGTRTRADSPAKSPGPH